MKLKKIFHEYQGLIISIGILIMCGLGFILGIVPLAEKAIDLNNDYSTLSAQVNELNNKISVLQTVNEDEMRNDVQILLSAVPSDKSLATLLGTLDGLAAKTGVSIGELSLSKPGSLSTASAERLTSDEQVVGSNILPFTVSMTGTLDQIRAFLTAGISVRRLFRIRTFNVSFLKTATESAYMVSANIAMDAFYSPLLSAIGSARQPITALFGTDTDLISKISGMQSFAAPSFTLPPSSSGAAKSDPFSL